MKQFEDWLNKNDEIVFGIFSIICIIYFISLGAYVLTNAIISKKINDIEKLKKICSLLSRRSIDFSEINIKVVFLQTIITSIFFILIGIIILIVMYKLGHCDFIFTGIKKWIKK